MAPADRNKPVLALGLRLVAVGTLATMMTLVKLAGENGIHLAEIMFWRQFATVPLMLAFLAWTGNLSILRTQRLSAHVRRALLGSLAMALTFLAVMLLPLAEAQTLNFTVPIFATLLSIGLLGERIGPWRWAALFAGFAGILVITRPGYADLPLLGTAVGLCSAFMIALLTILIRDLNRTDSPVSIVFYFSAFSAFVLAFSLPFVATHHGPYGWGLLLSLGVLGAIAQLLITFSLRFGAVSSVIVMDYSGLFWATLFGWLVWDQWPQPATWIGAPLIVGAGLLIAWREHRLARDATANVIAR